MSAGDLSRRGTKRNPPIATATSDGAGGTISSQLPRPAQPCPVPGTGQGWCGLGRERQARVAAVSFRPLEGIRVVDLTSSLAGPTATEILGALGADVIKIEHPQRGDEARAWGPRFFEGGSVMFFAANASKRSLALDVKDPAGNEALLRLAERADVFVQSLRAGTAERLGFGSEALQARNPRLVYCSIGAFGRHGPLAEQPGYDPLMQAFAGIVSITGEPDRRGVRVGASLVDIGTGVWAALGIVAALHERERTGHGREVDVALFETALSLVGYQLTDALRSGVAPGRFGTAFPLIVPYEVFPTSDGELMISAANDKLFSELAERIGCSELADDARFRTNPDRIANRDALLPLIRERLAAQPSAYWLERLEGIPVAPVQDLAQVAQHEQTRASGMLQALDGVETVALPLQVDRERVEHRTPPPLLGRDSAAILAELGYSDDEIADLAARDVTAR
jgi:crotonobetainyl-CoA:carnitine CoA-transferase CaiB-like acyl-CoA transferase